MLGKVPSNGQKRRDCSWSAATFHGSEGQDEGTFSLETPTPHRIRTDRDQAQELQRIRDNQQRSRDRKRAYINELEEHVRQLSEKLQRCEPREPQTAGASDIAQENDARRELLKALGIDDAAQQQFVQAFSKRNAVQQMTAELQSAEAGGVVEQDIGVSIPRFSVL